MDLERGWFIWSLSEPYRLNERSWWDVVAFDTIFVFLDVIFKTKQNGLMSFVGFPE